MSWLTRYRVSLRGKFRNTRRWCVRLSQNPCPLFIPRWKNIRRTTSFVVTLDGRSLLIQRELRSLRPARISCVFPKVAKRSRWVVPSILRPMLLKYFHDSALAGHLGAFKTFRKIVTNFLWPKMRAEIFQYVQKCNLCQRAKPAQDTRVGLHAAHPPLIPWRKCSLTLWAL